MDFLLNNSSNLGAHLQGSQHSTKSCLLGTEILKGVDEAKMRANCPR